LGVRNEKYRLIYKVLATLLVILALIVGLAAGGYLVFSEFINHPTINNGELVDQLGRKVYPAPWFVRTFLMFLTDGVSENIETEVGKTIVVPWAPGKYWLGWKWSTIDWIGSVILIFGAFGLGVVGVDLWDRGKK
jgi:hypothetical protein